MRLQDIIAKNLKLDEKAIAADPELSKQIQTRLSALRLLDPPSDGDWGKQSAGALSDFQSFMKVPVGAVDGKTAEALIEKKELIPLKLGSDLASRIVKYAIAQGYFVPVGARHYFICYLEGCNADGSLNSDAPDHWNDRRIVIEIPDGRPKIVANYLSTSEPGSMYTHKPLNPEGAARIAFGQYKSWSVGNHKGQDALVQVKELPVYRDRDRNFQRSGDVVRVGLWGLNQHTTNRDPVLVGGWSAGCLVGKSEEEHKLFMALVRKDRRYQISSYYVFMTAIIDGSDLIKKFRI